MADVVDLLNINDITIMRTLDPEDDLADWKDTKLLARVLVDGELLDETEACLPIMYEGVSARPAARWELGGLQVPTECIPFTLAITTTGHFEIMSFQLQEQLDGKWWAGVLESEMILGRFHARAILHHSPSHLHRCLLATSTIVFCVDIPIEPRDDRLDRYIRLLAGFTSAEVLLDVGRGYYKQSHCGRKKQCLKLARTTLERALEDPNIDPGLSQVLETTIPFLYCFEQGHTSSLDVALEVLQTFPGLPNAQLDAQLFLQDVLYDIGRCCEWWDHLPLIIKSITGPLKLLLCSSSPPMHLFHQWVLLASCVTPNAKEVLPLMDLVVDFHSSPPNLEDFEFLAIRAIAYFKQPLHSGGPSLDMTLGAAESVRHALSGQEESLGGATRANLIQCSFNWLRNVVRPRDLAELEPYKDRLLSLMMWLRKFLLSQAEQWQVRSMSHLLRRRQTPLATVKAYLPELEGTILDENDDNFIEASLGDLHLQRCGTEMPAEYPKGAAELVRNYRKAVARGATDQMYCGMVATIACALRLPEAFELYEHFMSASGSNRLSLQYPYLARLDAAHVDQDWSRGYIRDAISCAADMGNHALALQWSDQGCSPIWEWFFYSRSFIERVYAIEPILATKLKTRPRWMDSPTKLQPTRSDTYLSQDAGELSQKIDDYNRLPGLDRFWRPKTPAEIISLAEVLGGPIVYLNTNRHSSQALAVLPGLDDVIHIPLSRINYSGLRGLSVDFMTSPQIFLREEFSTERKGFLVKPAGTSQPPPSCRNSARILLEQLWIGIVKPVLDELGIQHAQTRTADMPRIWWCPSGPLIGLPIHAAGVYTDDGQGQAISDYVVSSYFPSASALAYATRPEDPSQKFSLLTIANPTGAGLPGTEWELEKIKTHVTTQELTREEATIEAVKQGMKKTSWAHFACHGVTNPGNPMEGALILANHTRLTLREISDMSLPHAEFAYLSACQTAKGVAEAPDESAQLSTGMMACGYRSIIGTLWSIKDEYAPFVADRVYAKMLEGGQPDYKRAAYALHDAVQALRKEHKVPFATWLPFIHVGV